MFWFKQARSLSWFKIKKKKIQKNFQNVLQGKIKKKKG